MDEFAFGLLRNGILAIKEGDVRMACRYLEHVTDLTNDHFLLAGTWLEAHQ